MNKKTLDRINELVPQLDKVKWFLDLKAIELLDPARTRDIDFLDEEAVWELKEALYNFKCRLERELKELGYEEDEE